AHVLTQEASAADYRRLPVVPAGILDGQTIPVGRDQIELYLLSLLDLLTAHAASVGAGGRAQVVGALAATNASAWSQVAVVSELTDDTGSPNGWRLASARARLPREAVILQPVTQTVRLAEMRDAQLRLRAAYRLAAELLAIFGVDGP